MLIRLAKEAQAAGKILVTGECESLEESGSRASLFSLFRPFLSEAGYMLPA